MLDIWKVQPVYSHKDLGNIRSRHNLNGLYYDRKTKDKRYNFCDLLQGFNAERAYRYKEGEKDIESKPTSISFIGRCSNCFNTIIGNEKRCGKCDGLVLKKHDSNVFFDEDIFKELVKATPDKNFELRDDIEREMVSLRRRKLDLLRKMDEKEMLRHK